MKRIVCMIAAAIISATALMSSASAEAYRPAETVRSEDGTSIRVIYELTPEDDAGGIPVDDFEQDGFHYTFEDLVRQEVLEMKEQEAAETTTVKSGTNDPAAILAQLPAQMEVTTGDGFSGVLALDLDSVHTEPSEYGTESRTVTAIRSYSGFYLKDENSIPRTITENGSTLTLQSIGWQVDSMGIYTATAVYGGTVSSRYVKAYTTTAEYRGTVSKTVVRSIRYEAIFTGTEIPEETPFPTPTPEPAPIPTQTPEPENPPAPLAFHWLNVWIPLGVLALGGGAIAAALFIKRRREFEYEDEDEED